MRGLLVAESGERLEVGEELLAVGRRGPDGGRIAAVGRGDRRAQTSCTRPAIDRGKRWSAGLAANTSASSSGSMAASAAASRVPPSRSRRSNGA